MYSPALTVNPTLPAEVRCVGMMPWWWQQKNKNKKYNKDVIIREKKKHDLAGKNASEILSWKCRKQSTVKTTALVALSFSPLPDFQSDNFAAESDCGFNQWKGQTAGGNLRKKTQGLSWQCNSYKEKKKKHLDLTHTHTRENLMVNLFMNWNQPH